MRSISSGFSSYEEAYKKAEDPNMTLANNPLVDDKAEVESRRVVSRNMRRLEDDARARNCPHNGGVYTGIMNTRFGG